MVSLIDAQKAHTHLKKQFFSHFSKITISTLALTQKGGSQFAFCDKKTQVYRTLSTHSQRIVRSSSLHLAFIVLANKLDTS